VNKIHSKHKNGRKNIMKLKYLKSSDLENLKKIKKTKRILLINPKKEDTVFMIPHNGLASLAGVLKKRGHEVLVVDFAFLFEDRDKDVSFFINMFKPDIIGISIYTPSSKEANDIIKKIQEISPKIPIMVGGPHASMYSDVLKKDKRIDYIFIGEAELTIIPVVENAKKQRTAKIIKSKEILNLYKVPFSDYKSFYGWQNITSYPIMSSRGCPNKCSFCASIGLSYRYWRPRKPEECIKEMELAKKEISPNLRFVLFDDCPTVHMGRFINLLKLYIEKINSELVIVNTRADSLNEEIVKLIKQCNCRVLSVGVEHGNPEVFKMANKGETFEQIEEACRLIKKYGIRLSVSFIIGLPGDSLERTKDSIKLCNKLKADQVSLNLFIPFRYTPAREWLEKNNGIIYNELEYGSSVTPPLECPIVMSETPTFTKFEIEKAFYMFLFGVAEPRLKFRYLLKIISIAMKYNLYLEFISWLPRGIYTSIRNMFHVAKYGFYVYRKVGFKNLSNRLIKMHREKKAQKDYLKKHER